MRRLTGEPFKECPSFYSCSCNVCPLDFDMAKRFALPEEEECRAHRPTRVAIAARYPDLPTGGLTYAEVARDARRSKARERWAAMSPEERAKRLPGRFEKGPRGVIEGEFSRAPADENPKPDGSTGGDRNEQKGSGALRRYAPDVGFVRDMAAAAARISDLVGLDEPQTAPASSDDRCRGHYTLRVNGVCIQCRADRDFYRGASLSASEKRKRHRGRSNKL